MSKPDISSRSVRFVVAKFGLAIVSVAVALGLALIAQSLSIENVTFPLFLMAIAVAVWNAGPAAGALAVVLASRGIDYFFIVPLYDLSIQASERPLVAIFVLFALLIASFAFRRLRIEHERAKRAPISRRKWQSGRSRPASSISRTTPSSSAI